MSGIMLNMVGVSAATVPAAPTIGTATATGSTTATVAYTAPASNGGSVITSYTATSSPSGITGTLSQAGSGTITVTGLTGGTNYTFTVTATNAIGTSAASAASNSITTLYTIGQALGGGYFAGQISTAGNGIADYNLIIGPVSAAQNSSKQWKISNTTTSGTSSLIDGPANSSAMNNASHPAAQFCEAVNTGGFTDWYMPAKNELEVCYYFLKPNTSNNATASGSNANAVSPEPLSTNYTTGSPAQTSAAAFQTGGAEAFSAGIYWSSTQNSSTTGWSQYFASLYGQGSGHMFAAQKSYNYFSVRAVRRVAV